ncbi:nuclease domain-containing protein [Photobacterium nomapromontoriensis]|uniref:nuclease domain-containing protein n=1 Tax=Photobacterium nomapromontoriensis TaxID=2910237 RepID=UPI003D152504
MAFKSPALRSDKLRKAAKGQQCVVQIMGVCNFNPETVVLAHLPSNTHGMAYKSDDIWAVLITTEPQPI